MSTLEYLKAASLQLSRLEEAGLTVHMTSDFEEVELAIRDIGKSYLTPKMDPTNNDFTEENSFWLFLMKDGEYVGGVAARHDILRTEPVSEFWRRAYRRYYPNISGETFALIESSVLANMTGGLTYVGDLFIREGNRGSREVLNSLMLLMHINCALKWESDWLYAFMWDRHVSLGMAAKYGFTRTIPGIRKWVAAPEGRRDDEWLVSLPRTELEHLVKLQAQLADGAGMVRNEVVSRPVSKRDKKAVVS